jgi:hypothetical protein
MESGGGSAECLTFKNSFKKDPTKSLIATAALMAYPTLKTAIPIFMGCRVMRPLV